MLGSRFDTVTGMNPLAHEVPNWERVLNNSGVIFVRGVTLRKSMGRESLCRPISGGVYVAYAGIGECILIAYFCCSRLLAVFHSSAPSAIPPAARIHVETFAFLRLSAQTVVA